MRYMAAFLKLPPQEFTVKAAVLLAAGMQFVAALGSGIMGTIIGMMHLGGTTMARLAQTKADGPQPPQES